ncbi:hypothetical protein D3C81_445760 [compost metagenome]
MLVNPSGGFVVQAGAEQVLDGRDRLRGVEEPVGRRFVQVLGHVRVYALQCVAQETGEQMVVTEPLLLTVHRHQEQVGTVQVLKHGRAVAAARHGLAQRHAELLEDAGLHQEQAARFALTHEDIFSQVLGQLQV